MTRKEPEIVNMLITYKVLKLVIRKTNKLSTKKAKARAHITSLMISTKHLRNQTVHISSLTLPKKHKINKRERNNSQLFFQDQ